MSTSGEVLVRHDRGVFDVAFSPDGHLLATTEIDDSDDSDASDGVVRLWDTRDHRQRGTPLSGHEGPVHGVAFSPDGRFLVTASSDGTVRRWDVTEPRAAR